MDRRVRLGGIGAVIVTALLATLLLTPPEGSLSVDDVMDDPDQRKGDTISVRGVVENGSFDTQAGIFALSGESSILSVKIGAAQLSTAFSEGKTILVTGELVLNGVEWQLHAEDIQVGCPSKYEAEEAALES